jgi:Kef-type K+ transport system membrane component KefB
LVAAARVGVLSMIVPFLLALAIAPLLFSRYAPAGTRVLPFTLFVAVALSVTAFPVMARILKDRALVRTTIGQLSLGAAAIIDVSAWIGLALVVAVAPSHGSWRAFGVTLAGLVVLTGLVFLVVRPRIARLLARLAPGGHAGVTACGALLAVLLASASATHWLGLHPVFGAFLFGASLPRCDALLARLTTLLERVTMVALLPVFFALAGLGTSSGALAGASLAAFALLFAVAVAGKVLGGVAGARLAGYGWRDCLAVGALMNTRGLMELVVIRIGLDAGLIGPELFTMLLLMTLATTLMTSPLLAVLAPTARVP